MIQCRACELVQVPAIQCRRCQKPFPVVAATAPLISPTASVLEFGATLPTVDELVALLIAAALERTHGDRHAAATMIGMGKTTLYRKLKAA